MRKKINLNERLKSYGTSSGDKKTGYIYRQDYIMILLALAVITLLVVVAFQGNWIYRNADTIRTVNEMQECYGETLEELNFKMELVKEIEYNRGETLEDLQVEFMK